MKIKFGLEICYFEKYEAFIREQSEDKGLIFCWVVHILLGILHLIINQNFWIGVDVDSAYRSYFERSISLASSNLFDGIAHPTPLVYSDINRHLI